MEKNEAYAERAGDQLRAGASTQAAPEVAAVPGPCCMVVMYHYIHDDKPWRCGGIAGLTTGEFRAQLDRLCSTLEPVDWPTLFAWRLGRGSIPNRCFLLTFDDGLIDHAETVLPILQERDLRGVFFVPGRVLTGYHMLPAHAIHVLMSAMGEAHFRDELLLELTRQGIDEETALKVDPAAAEAMYHYESPARAHLKYLLTKVLPIETRDLVVDRLFERHIGSSARWARHWYMSWDDLVALESSGHTVGGHGYLHEPYDRLSAEECRCDVARVATVLRDGLGPDKRPFSYPYGSVTDMASVACAAVGFPHAFTTRQAMLTADGDLHHLPRFDTIAVTASLQTGLLCTPA